MLGTSLQVIISLTCLFFQIFVGEIVHFLLLPAKLQLLVLSDTVEDKPIDQQPAVEITEEQIDQDNNVQEDQEKTDSVDGVFAALSHHNVTAF